MASTVYFAKSRTRGQADNKAAKVARLCEAVGLKNVVHEADLTAVKLHFGESGNDTYLQPTLVQEVVAKIREAGGKPFLTDTSTLYSGSRSNAVDHLGLAARHGFTWGVVDAPVIIADGLRGLADVPVEINCKRFKEVYIAQEIRQASSLVVLSHFKGHEMAGFGGAVKNLAMGCASVRGKQAQHETKVGVDEKKCIGCGQCAKVCPKQAIAVQAESKKAKVDPTLCIGCFECITVCRPKAVSMDWATEIPAFMERLTEYAYGAVKGLQDRTCYINFVLNVTPDCDCVPWSDAPLVSDIGILASCDPVALDKACYDLVTAAQGLTDHKGAAAPCGTDKFSARWKHTQGLIQISYGEAIGLGSSEYELVTV